MVMSQKIQFYNSNYSTQKSILRYFQNSNNRINNSSSFLSSNRKVNQKLQSIDIAVKAHEKTHLMILGGYASSVIQYDYIILPSGEHYAVGGSIGVDLKPVPGNPEATIRKARIIRLAALGPMSPSAADKRIAIKAYQMEMQAQRQLKKQELEVNINLEIGEMSSLSNNYEETIIPEVQVIPGNPEATIQQARTIRRRIFMQNNVSFRNMQILIKAYQIEKQAHKEIKKQEANKQHSINIKV